MQELQVFGALVGCTWMELLCHFEVLLSLVTMLRVVFSREYLSRICRNILLQIPEPLVSNIHVSFM